MTPNHDELIDEIKNNPYEFICGFAEKLYPFTGRESFSVLALLPVSMFIKDITYLSKKMRANLNCMFLSISGGAKCLEENSKVYLCDGSSKKIKDFKGGEEIFSLDEDKWRIVNSKVKSVINNGKKNTFKLVLRSGRKIVVTDNHPFYTIDGWKELKEIPVGSYISVPRRLNIEESPSGVRDCEIKILAYLLADGYIGQNKILFTKRDMEVLQEFKDSIKEFSDNLKVTEYSKKGTLAKSLQVSSIRFKKDPNKMATSILPCREKNDLIRWITSLGLIGKNSYEKFIPADFMKLPESRTSLLLNRMFSCDGSVSREKSRELFRYSISYCSCSEVMLKQIHQLLIRKGIVSKIRKCKTQCNGKDFYSYKLEIRDVENMKRFVRNIGLIKGKEGRCVEILDLNINSNTNIDLVPTFKEKVIEYKNKNNLSWDKIIKGGWKKASVFNNHKHIFSVGRIKKLRPIGFEKYYDNDILWDEVLKINPVGIKNVYDLEIEGHHNFVSEGIIVHNSSICSLFSKFVYNPIEVKSITPAELEDRCFKEEEFTLIIEDYATMSADERINKVIEGCIGEEKIIDRHTKTKDIRKQINTIALLCGVPSDLSNRLTSGTIFRTIPLIIMHNDDEHSDIGKHISKFVGVSGDFDVREEVIKEYYDLLRRIQNGDREMKKEGWLKVENFVMSEEIRKTIQEEWEKMTRFYRKNAPYNFFRELWDGYRILFAHCFLNYFNRERDGDKIYITKEDLDVALKIMKRTMNTKYELLISEKMIRGIRDINQLKVFMNNNNIPRRFRQLVHSRLRANLK